MKQYTVAISLAGHESSLCILEDGDISLLLMEERLSRIKKDSSLPLKLIDKIKEYTNHIEHLLLINFNNNIEVEYVKNHLHKEHITFNKFTVDTCGAYHHLSHASSGFYFSGFENAICLVMDGIGGTYRIKDYPIIDAAETTSIFYAEYPAKFDLKFKNLFYLAEDGKSYFDEDKKYIQEILGCHVNVSHRLDVGLFYSAISKHLKFGQLNGGKTMGLSSYGKENPEIPNVLLHNSILTNMNLFRQNRILDTECYPILSDLNFQQKSDLAFAAQKASEKVILERVRYISDNFECKNLVFSGGCALNILANTRIKEEFPHINLFVDPIAGDANQSLGMAKFAFHRENVDSKIRKNNSIYLGPKYNQKIMHEEIESFLGGA